MGTGVLTRLGTPDGSTILIGIPTGTITECLFLVGFGFRRPEATGNARPLTKPWKGFQKSDLPWTKQLSARSILAAAQTISRRDATSPMAIAVCIPNS
jgi:hypothetical protein